MEGSCSHAEKHTIVYKWEINDITSFINAARGTKELEEIKSSKFSAGSKLNDSWYLKLEIDKDSESSESKSWVSLYLYSNNDKKVRAKYITYFLDNENKKRWVDLQILTDPTDSKTDRFFNNLYEGWGRHKFIKIDELFEKKDELLKNDTLTVCVDLTVYDNYVGIDNSVSPVETPVRKLADDLEDLFVSKKKCDLVIKVGERNFDAHKIILFARSSVFEAMFTHDMKENKENEVTIPDIDPEIFQKILDYIYTDKVDELDNYAEELLEASDKYQLQGLKHLCETSLSRTLTFENVARRLILADRHSTEKLKETAIDYIAVNWTIFKTTEQFKPLEESHPSLAYAVTRKVINGFERKVADGVETKLQCSE